MSPPVLTTVLSRRSRRGPLVHVSESDVDELLSSESETESRRSRKRRKPTLPTISAGNVKSTYDKPVIPLEDPSRGVPTGSVLQTIGCTRCRAFTRKKFRCWVEPGKQRCVKCRDENGVCEWDSNATPSQPGTLEEETVRPNPSASASPVTRTFDIPSVGISREGLQRAIDSLTARKEGLILEMSHLHDVSDFLDLKIKRLRDTLSSAE